MSNKKNAKKIVIAKITKQVNKAPIKDIQVKAKDHVDDSVITNKLNPNKYYSSLYGVKNLVSKKPKIKRLKLYVWNIGGAHSLFYALAYSLSHARKILSKDINIKGNTVREAKLASSPIEFKRPTSMILTF